MRAEIPNGRPLDQGAKPPAPVRGLSRREFLARAAVSAGTALTTLHADSAADISQVRLPAHSTVHEFHLENVLRTARVHPAMLREMFDTALRTAAGAQTEGRAWRRWLRDDDLILIKFNGVGAAQMVTSEELARTIVDSLERNGFSPERIMLLEAPPGLAQKLRTLPPPAGWSATVHDFGSGSDQFRACLEAATAVVNVPLLKTHNLAGFTCSLKNLSHGLVRHPARYHANGCSPYIGDIVAAPPIRSKLRLNVVNALRVLYDGGPEVRPQNLHPAETLIFGDDPVAVDAVALDLLNSVRRLKSLALIGSPGAPVPYLAAAQQRGMGAADLDLIARMVHFL